MHVFVTRFCALNALLFRDVISRETNEDNRISLLMLVWGMAPFHLYFLAVKKLISTLRNAYQEASFYSTVMESCPEGFDTVLFKELILYLFLMDSRDIPKEAISWMTVEEENSDLLNALCLLEKNIQSLLCFDVATLNSPHF